MDAKLHAQASISQGKGMSEAHEEQGMEWWIVLNNDPKKD